MTDDESLFQLVYINTLALIWAVYYSLCPMISFIQISFRVQEVSNFTLTDLLVYVFRIIAKTDTLVNIIGHFGMGAVDKIIQHSYH